MNHPPRRLLSALTIGALSAAGVGLLATAAHANAVPTTKSVAWVVTSGSFADRFGTPQRLATAADTCGVIEQVDVYRYGTPDDIAFVDVLIAKGTLASSAEDGEVYISNEDVTLPTCTTPPVTTPPTAPPTTAPPVPVSTDSPSPTAEPTHAPTPGPTASSPAPSTSSTAAPVAKIAAKDGASSTLAYTGSRGWVIGTVVAIVLIFAGLAAVFVGRRHEKGEEGE